jgi:hypothetical protein
MVVIARIAVSLAARRLEVTEVIKDAAPRCLRDLGQLFGEGIVLLILDDQRVDASRLGERGADMYGCILFVPTARRIAP